ncbi:MAG: hypothetical protein ACI8X5_001712 [Planctomycetota bacterium]|jgi:hypothetical protein
MDFDLTGAMDERFPTGPRSMKTNEGHCARGHNQHKPGPTRNPY